MAKVRCKACQSETNGFCSVKKIGVAVNKPRKCNGFMLEEGKLKEKQSIPTQFIGYTKKQELKAAYKEERRKFLKALKAGPGNKTAKALGLETEESNIIVPGDPNFRVPTGDMKHPTTGDLSRFTTTADVKPENTHASKVKV